MDIIKSFYYSENKERQKELEYVLDSNLKKKFISRIHLFINEKDHKTFLKSKFVKHNNYEKINCILKNEQPKYPDLFIYSSKLENRICCLCNSDIEFKIKNRSLLDRLNNNNLIYFLTRREVDGSKYLIDNFGGSHDAFIFHSNRLKKNIANKDLSFINYIQNTSGIEALLTIFFIEKLKYKIKNPCFQIKLIHHHKSNIRLWQKKENKPIGYTSKLPKKNYSNGEIHCKYIISPCKM